MHVLFANTGVQLVCVPLRGGSRYHGTRSATAGSDAAAAAAEGRRAAEFSLSPVADHPVGRHAAVSGRRHHLRRSGSLAISAQAASLTKDFIVRLEGLLDVAGQAAAGRSADGVVHPPRRGHRRRRQARAHGGRLRQQPHRGAAGGDDRRDPQTPQMLPFELVNRYHLDAWDDNGPVGISTPAARWFSSKTHWCNTPYLPPLAAEKDRVSHGRRGGAAAGLVPAAARRPKQAKVEVTVTPPLFDDLSMVRMGREADDVVQVMRVEGDIRTGVSSPKRYLWADDASWLEGANWYMADPADRCQHAAPTPPRSRARCCATSTRTTAISCWKTGSRRRASSPPRRR